MQKVSFILNDQPVEVKVKADMLLVDLLRETLDLTGTKESCREGECGACTVMLDGKPVSACLVAVCTLQGHKVTTIEGLRENPLAQRVMQALAAFGASQCGYCTPGMVMAGLSILQDGRCKTPDQVRQAIEGNLCRCTGYQKIVDAIMWCIENG